MSKYNNVNPDHYKVAGRERPGNAVAKAPKTEAELEKTRARWFERQRREQKAPNKEGAGTAEDTE
jgi:hypothetical protein